MNGLLLLLPAIPLLLSIGALSGKLQARGVLLTVGSTGALAGVLAILPPEDLEAGWLLLGATLGLDATGRALLGAAAILWPVATMAARELFTGESGPRFAMCFLLTLAGNLGVLVSQDAATFYLSFAVMTFAAYGLVVHDGTAEAVRAGRIYLILSIAGEALLLSGLFLLAAQVGNPVAAETAEIYGEIHHPGLIGALLLAGFAVKMGVVPLHVWLPLAHPAAPPSASAILSGLLVKGGLLGWLRFLPEGDPALTVPGDTLAALGLAAAFLAALVGCFQERAKTVLAYSTVSQMGLLSVLAGLLIAGRGEAEILLPAIALFALHHALVKGALFLAVAHLKDFRPLFLAATTLAVLALAGAPLTSGLVAKGAVKASLTGSLSLLVTFTSLTTTLLLLRFLALAWPRRDTARRPGITAGAGAWLLLVAASQALPWLAAEPAHRAYALQAGSLWDSLWPLLLAGALALVAWRLLRPWWRLPEGDLVIPAEWLVLAGYRTLVDAIAACVYPLRRRQDRRPPWRAFARMLNDREADVPWVGVQLLALVLLLPLLYLLAI